MLSIVIRFTKKTIYCLKKDEVGETMKKIVLSVVSLGLFAGLAVGCSSDQEKKMGHKTSKESTEEVTSGASANGYTDISELKDSLML